MKRLKVMAFAIAMMLSSCQAFAAGRVLEARDQAGSVVTISDEPCTNEVAKKQLPKLRAITGMDIPEGDLHGGSLTFQGKRYGICWVGIDPFVAIMDDGDADDSLFPVPMSDFKKPEII